MKALRGANDVLAFLLELAALAALAVWGFTVGPNLVLRVLFGVGAPLLMIVVWSRWLAPRARHPLSQRWTIVGKSVVFLVAAAALWWAGYPWLAVVLAVLGAVTLGLWAAIGSAADAGRPRG